MFLAINSETFDTSEDSQWLLSELLKAVDHVPLAIHLLAHVSIGLLPHQVMDRWRNEKSSMLSVSSKTAHKLESVDVSISLSITYLDIDENSEAIQLLGMLCLLPDELLRWHERLRVVAQSFGSAFSSLDALHKHALIYTEGDKLGVLSPIRHFVLHHHPPDAEHVYCMYDVFRDFVDTHTQGDLGPRTRALWPDKGNIFSLFKYAVIRHPTQRLFQLAIKMLWQLYRTTPSTSFLDIIRHLLPDASPETQAEYWSVMGEALAMQTFYKDANESLVRARTQWLELNDGSKAAHCSLTLSKIILEQRASEQAESKILQARDFFAAAGDKIGEAASMFSLGHQLLFH